MKFWHIPLTVSCFVLATLAKPVLGISLPTLENMSYRQVRELLFNQLDSMEYLNIGSSFSGRRVTHVYLGQIESVIQSQEEYHIMPVMIHSPIHVGAPGENVISNSRSLRELELDVIGLRCSTSKRNAQVAKLAVIWLARPDYPGDIFSNVTLPGAIDHQYYVNGRVYVAEFDIYAQNTWEPLRPNSELHNIIYERSC